MVPGSGKRYPCNVRRGKLTLETACWADDVEASSQEASERAAQRGSRVEDADAQRELFPAVEEGEIENHAWQEAPLGDPEEGADRGKGRKAANEAETHGQRAPNHGQGGKPYLGRDFLEHEVRWKLTTRALAAWRCPATSIATRPTLQCTSRKRRTVQRRIGGR